MIVIQKYVVPLSSVHLSIRIARTATHMHTSCGTGIISSIKFVLVRDRQTIEYIRVIHKMEST